MHATPTLYALGTCLLAVTVAAASAGPSWFEAHTTGAQVLTLRGSAEFGVVEGVVGAEPFVLTLGAESATGAVVFTWANGVRPGAGTYQLADDPANGVRALVVTGPATRPTGAFRSRGGTLTITRSSGDSLEGRFEIDAVGFEIAEPMDEGRELIVRGEFTAVSAPSVRSR
jgi:hypothetical protein